MHRKWPPSTSEVVLIHFRRLAEHSNRCPCAQWKSPPSILEAVLVRLWSPAVHSTKHCVCCRNLRCRTRVRMSPGLPLLSSFLHYPLPLLPLFSGWYPYIPCIERRHALTPPWGGLQLHGSWVRSWVGLYLSPFFRALHRPQVSQHEQLLSGIGKQNCGNVMTARKSYRPVWCGVQGVLQGGGV